ncbi:MAG: alpha/beta hydrolase [Cyanobacteria bacterium QS_5_48_63]|nr:MAG: alpha/beta hydrolase [Cyanobacteria bacterium QS_5_48_63]
MTAISNETTQVPSSSTFTEIGGVVHEYDWNWQGQPLTVVYETRGEGTPILLLPAFSTVSTRAEMRGLAERLSAQFEVFALDWIGFGQSSRPSLVYCPELYQQFLQDFVRDQFETAIPVVAAGHAAGYVLQLAQNHPSVLSKMVLVAPTWQSPLRVMSGEPQGWHRGIRELVRSPLLGQAIYQLNTTPAFLRFMYGQHVYVDDTRLTPEFIAKKRQITQSPGARFAPAAFVTGGIDPVSSRAELLSYLQPLPVPVKMIIGEQVPPNSKAEMEALAELTGVEASVLPGSLGMHEEYPDSIFPEIANFL